MFLRQIPLGSPGTYYNLCLIPRDAEIIKGWWQNGQVSCYVAVWTWVSDGNLKEDETRLMPVKSTLKFWKTKNSSWFLRILRFWQFLQFFKTRSVSKVKINMKLLGPLIWFFFFLCTNKNPARRRRGRGPRRRYRPLATWSISSKKRCMLLVFDRILLQILSIQ